MFKFGKLAGKNSHHIIEATFKAFARALRQATELDLRRQGSIPRYDFLYHCIYSKLIYLHKVGCHKRLS